MEEKGVLLQLYRGAKTAVASKRYHAILLVKEGRLIKEVAELFYVNEDTVSSWVKKWDEQKKVEDEARSGKPPTIKKEIEEDICKAVDENNPEKEGMPSSAWDCKELGIWLKDKYGVEVSRERIRQLLRKHGFHWRKQNHDYTKKDEQKRGEFLDGVREIDTASGTLIFEDEMASKLHPHKGYIWTREKKPCIETACSHEKTYVVGGVSPETGEIYTLTHEKFNSVVYISFLRMLLSSLQGTIYLVTDNHPSHHSKATQGFLEQNTRIQIIYLPEYSPDLNPQEEFWNYLRKKFLNNKVFKSVSEMAEGVKSFIKSVSKEVVKKICSYKHLLR